MRRKIIVNDPIHRVMSFGSDDTVRDVLKAVIDTKEFQRLRRISQLGLASYVFPGATHTRFSHAFGVAFLASSVVDHLIELERNNDVLRRQMERLRTSIMLSALLHDVGHGPFSHSFEKVLKGLEKAKKFAPLHEDWSADLIKSRQSDIGRGLRRLDIDPYLVASPFMEEPSAEYPQFLKQIVSSQLDVDRMDYLLRDAHFSGVDCGTFDVHYLINSLAIVQHGTRHVRTLGLSKKGIKVYENYVLARHQMNRSVYFHPRVKVLEFMMEEFIRFVILNLRLIDRISSVKKAIPDYIRSMAEAIRDEESGLTKSEFIRRHRDSYTKLTESEIWTLIGATSASCDQNIPRKMSDLSNRILERKPLEHELIQSGKELLLKDRLIERGYKEGEDFTIVPLESTMYKKSKDKVFVSSFEGPALEVTSHSDIISAFRDKAEIENLLILIDPSKRRLFDVAKDLRAIPIENEDTLSAA